MGKAKDKDTTTNQLPVENYRKQIGKQDYKKSKAELKEIKSKAQAKQGLSSTYQDIAIMIGSMIALVGILYALMYMMLEKKDADVTTSKM